LRSEAPFSVPDRTQGPEPVDGGRAAPPSGPGGPGSRRRAEGGGRNLKLAIVTGVALAGAVVGLLAVGPEAFFALAALLILVGQGELYLAARKAGRDPAMLLGLVAGLVLLAGVFLRGEQAAGLILFLTLLLSFVWYLVSERRAAEAASDIAVTVLGVAYVPLLGSFAGLIARRPDGRGVIVAMILATAVYDIAAYAGGSRFGRHKLAPTISPNKSVEGAIVATLGTLVVGTAGAVLLGPWSLGQAVVFSLLVCVAAPLGDLVESMVKRDFGIKDMGSILPGHGGILDRIDALLFVAPATYLSLKVFGL
jgi:phosphatidate cytidylyltransferase